MAHKLNSKSYSFTPSTVSFRGTKIKGLIVPPSIKKWNVKNNPAFYTCIGRQRVEAGICFCFVHSSLYDYLKIDLPF